MWEYLSTHALEIAGVILGIIYLIQELKASRALWITGMVMPAISLFVYWRAGLYADFAIDIYYLLAAVYGFVNWRRKGPEKEKIPITKTPGKVIPLLCAVFLVLFPLTAMSLIHFTDSTVPWQDAFTTALSVIGLWMLAKKWIEQWWVWAVVDIVSTCLYIYKGIPFYAGLYGLYTALAVYGYFRWKRSLRQEP